MFFKNYSLFIYTLLFAAFSVGAQIMIKAEPDKVFRIPELHVFLVEKDNQIRVEAALPQAERIEKYREVDIRKNDNVLMVNGKKVGSVKEIKKMYEDMKPGSEIKMGIQREDTFRMISFVKATEDELPKRGMVRMQVTDEDGKMVKKVINEKGEELTGEEAEKFIEKMKKENGKNEGVKIEVEEKTP